MEFPSSGSNVKIRNNAVLKSTPDKSVSISLTTAEDEYPHLPMQDVAPKKVLEHLHVKGVHGPGLLRQTLLARILLRSRYWTIGGIQGTEHNAPPDLHGLGFGVQAAIPIDSRTGRFDGFQSPSPPTPIYSQPIFLAAAPSRTLHMSKATTA